MTPARALKRARAALLGVLALSALAPGIASADSYVNTTPLSPSAGAGTFGPANQYPSSIVVSDAPGTVTGVTVQLLGLRSSNGDDLDMAIRGPNGQAVMLMSDACGDSAFPERNWTFDDDAPTFLSNLGPCGGGSLQGARLKPSNYVGNDDEDDLSSDGGPSPPYLNALSFFDGASANGSWDLFLRDDNVELLGFSTSGWVLNLDVEPPAAPAPPPEGSGTGKKCKKKGKKGKKAGASARKCKKRKKGKK